MPDFLPWEKKTWNKVLTSIKASVLLTWRKGVNSSQIAPSQFIQECFSCFDSKGFSSYLSCSIVEMKKESTDEILRYFDELERAPKEKTMIVFCFENCPLRVCQVRMFLVAIPSISEAQYSQKSVQSEFVLSRFSMSTTVSWRIIW